MFRLEQEFIGRRLVGELLDPLGQIGVVGKVTRHGLRQKSHTSEKKNCGSSAKSLKLKFRVAGEPVHYTLR